MINYLLVLTSLLLEFWLQLVTAECGSLFYECPSGECVKWRFYCDGQCHCMPDCADEDPKRCQVPGGQTVDTFKHSSSTSTTTMSGVMVGIVIACLVMLFLVVTVVLFFVVCRRRFAPKPPRVVADVRAMQESGGCGLPVDIPVQALTREPPPRYTSMDDLSTSSTSRQLNVSVSVLPPPPPYSAQVSARCDADDSLRSPPFDLDASRHSVSGIIIHASSPRVAPRAGSSSAGRLRSVDSFTECPSMSDILLTSSKSSLPTSSAGVTEVMGHASPKSRRSDSARGDSIDSLPSGEHSGTRSNDDLPQRSRSLTDVAVAHGGSGHIVPDSELQRKARRRGDRATPPSHHSISMDTGGSSSHSRRRTDSGSAAVQQRHHRRQNVEQRAGKRHKSRSLTQMTTVDEEQAASRLETPAFTGSAV